MLKKASKSMVTGFSLSLIAGTVMVGTAQAQTTLPAQMPLAVQMTADAIQQSLDSNKFSNAKLITSKSGNWHFIAQNDKKEWVHLETDEQGRILTETLVKSLNR